MQTKTRYFVPRNHSIDNLPTDIQHLFLCGFSDYSSHNLIFTNNSYYQLKSITIGANGFNRVRNYIVDGLESLEIVKIGVECFRISDDERNDGVCQITNCPNLRQLEIGDWSFEDFKSFEISNLNSLQSIKFGGYCFRYAEGFSLKR